MIRRPTLCLVCAHYGPSNDEGEPGCDAFPQGIPEEIHSGEFDHREPAPGDNGIRWKQASDAGAATVANALSRYDR